jgi:hypothetical protein
LVDRPGAVAAALGDPCLAAVEQVERGLDRLTHRALGGGRDVGALLEGVVDGLGKIGVRHGVSWRPSHSISWRGRGEGG